MHKYSILDADKVRFSIKKNQWITENYESNPYMPESLRYATTAGIRMRSKSERIIGNKLEEFRIPYRYEMKIEVGDKNYYPDFTIRRENGEIVLWEHLGMMEKEDYYYKALKKIDLYRKLGFKQHNNLICTWEDDLENMYTIENIIKRFIL